MGCKAFYLLINITRTYTTCMKYYQLLLLLGLLMSFLACQKSTKVNLTDPIKDTTITTDGGNFFDEKIQVSISSHLEHDALLETVTRRWEMVGKQAQPIDHIHTYYRIPVNQSITVLQDYADQHKFVLKPLGSNRGTLDVTVHYPASEDVDSKQVVGTDSVVIIPLSTPDK
jgi:hypothetical protein